MPFSFQRSTDFKLLIQVAKAGSGNASSWRNAALQGLKIVLVNYLNPVLHCYLELNWSSVVLASYSSLPLHFTLVQKHNPISGAVDEYSPGESRSHKNKPLVYIAGDESNPQLQ